MKIRWRWHLRHAALIGGVGGSEMRYRWSCEETSTNPVTIIVDAEEKEGAPALGLKADEETLRIIKLKHLCVYEYNSRKYASM